MTNYRSLLIEARNALRSFGAAVDHTTILKIERALCQADETPSNQNPEMLRAAAVEFVGRYMRERNDSPGAVDCFRAGVEWARGAAELPENVKRPSPLLTKNRSLREALRETWDELHSEKCTNVNNCTSFGGTQPCYCPPPPELADEPGERLCACIPQMNRTWKYCTDCGGRVPENRPAEPT